MRRNVRHAGSLNSLSRPSDAFWPCIGLEVKSALENGIAIPRQGSPTGLGDFHPHANRKDRDHSGCYWQALPNSRGSELLSGPNPRYVAIGHDFPLTHCECSSHSFIASRSGTHRTTEEQAAVRGAADSFIITNPV
jgi:hypothetical protein